MLFLGYCKTRIPHGCFVLSAMKISLPKENSYAKAITDPPPPPPPYYYTIDIIIIF